MTKLIVKEATTKKEMKQFVHFPNALYAGNKYYVPQIESMDMATFDRNRNHAFEVCDGKFWLAYDEQGKVVGRVAGIINRSYNKKVQEKICRFGWIDFIDNEEVSKALLDAVEQYARAEGMDTFSGPTGFLEFDVAGILVDGFDEIPTAYGKYNAPYYETHLVHHGYDKEMDYVEYRINIPESFPQRFTNAARIVALKNGLHEAPLYAHGDLLDYADGIFRCMNTAYSVLHGYSELTEGQCEDLKKQFFKNINLDFISVILNETNEVVAFGICLPSLSKALQKANGRLFPFGFLHILRALRHNDTLDTLLIAVTNKYKNKGVNAMIFDKMWQGIKKHGIKYVESTRELEDNCSVQNLWSRFDHRMHKRARIYRKQLDETP